MRNSILSMSALLLALPVAAETPPTMPPPAPPSAEPAYAVPVEQLTLGKGKGGFMTVAFATAGYNFSSSTSVQDGSERSVRVLGSTVSKNRVVVKYKVAKDGQPFDAGTCAVAVRMWSGLWNQSENSLYSCTRKDGGAGPADFALEAALPDIAPNSKASISMREDKPVDYTVLKARMRYSGSVYHRNRAQTGRTRLSRGQRLADHPRWQAGRPDRLSAAHRQRMERRDGQL